MTQSPHSGQAAPVDPTTGQTPQHGSAAPAAAYPTGGWGAASTTTAGNGAPPKLPRPDTPTDSVPIVNAAPTGGAAAPVGAGRRTRARGPRRAQLQLRHINPWTVLKFSCVLAIALFFVWLIMIGVLYGILDAAGVINKINDAYTTLKGDGGSAPVTAGIVFGSAAIVGLINIVLFIALSTIGSVVYNLCADLVGGIEVTLSER